MPVNDVHTLTGRFEGALLPNPRLNSSSADVAALSCFTPEQAREASDRIKGWPDYPGRAASSAARRGSEARAGRARLQGRKPPSRPGQLQGAWRHLRQRHHRLGTARSASRAPRCPTSICFEAPAATSCPMFCSSVRRTAITALRSPARRDAWAAGLASSSPTGSARAGKRRCASREPKSSASTESMTRLTTRRRRAARTLPDAMMISDSATPDYQRIPRLCMSGYFGHGSREPRPAGHRCAHARDAAGGVRRHGGRGYFVLPPDAG